MKRIVILCMMIIAFVMGCAPSHSSLEGRINQIEYYLVATSDGDDQIKVPNIYDITIQEKSEAINKLSFKIVKGNEQTLLSLLDTQWSEWRRDEGFIIEYLKRVEMLLKKTNEVLEDNRVSFELSENIGNLSTFYTQLIMLMNKQDKHIGEDLFILENTIKYSWQYQEGTMLLKSAEFNFFDISRGTFFSCKYKDSKVIVLPLESSDIEYGHTSLPKMVNSNLQADISTLIPDEVASAIHVVYVFKSQLEQGTEREIAIKSSNGYAPVAETVQGTVEGYVDFNWLSEDMNMIKKYILISEAPN